MLATVAGVSKFDARLLMNYSIARVNAGYVTCRAQCSNRSHVLSSVGGDDLSGNELCGVVDQKGDNSCDVARSA